MKKKVWMWQHLNSPVYGAKTNGYGYETTVDGSPWLADIEEDQMFDPKTFEVDPDPCGSGYKDVKSMREYLKESRHDKSKAKEVGYVEDGKLFITKRITVETGWGGFNSYDMFPTSIDTRTYKQTK